jgi:hypothetical protein
MLTASILLPTETLSNTANTLMITARSESNPLKFAISKLTALTISNQYWFPIIFKNWQP